jgi:hypothetical protein
MSGVGGADRRGEGRKIKVAMLCYKTYAVSGLVHMNQSVSQWMDK